MQLKFSIGTTPEHLPLYPMNQPIFSRAGLLVTITGVHAALLWAMQTVFNNERIEAPKPYPMVMAEMLPLQQPKPQPTPQPTRQPTPAPKPDKPEPRQKATPKPQPKPAPLAPSERAITTPQEVAQPEPAPAPAPAAPPVASAPPAPPSPPAPPTPPRFDAAYLNNPAPVYPPMARRMGQEGRVLLRVHVTAEGTAGDVRLHTSSGSSLLDEAAIAAVRKWRFVPARQGADAVAAWVQVPVSFKLN